MMFPSLAGARRRLGLVAGATLAAGALVLPAAAPADVIVHPATTTEGDSGRTRAVTTIDLTCAHPDREHGGRCTYELNFTAGTALGFEDFVWDPPQQLELFPPGGGSANRSVKMAVEVIGDTKLEPDEEYAIHVVEKTFDASDPFEAAPDSSLLLEHEDTYTAGTIVNDDGSNGGPADGALGGVEEAETCASAPCLGDGTEPLHEAPTTAVGTSDAGSGDGGVDADGAAHDGMESVQEAATAGPCFLSCD